jgi:hypothetical protein
MVFFLLVMVAIVFSSVWLTRRALSGWEQASNSAPRGPARPPAVPLDDAPPGVLDDIVASLRRSDPSEGAST